jgi:P pilus assembly chaperone PapD
MKSRSSHPESLCFALCLLLLVAAQAAADGFSVLVSPPRLELAGKPGEVIRDHIEISNPDNRPISLELRTADWDMSETGATTFYPPELQPGSCRPWARIERHTLRLPAQASRRYRFQIDIPADAPAGECRLALLLQAPADEAVVAKADTLSIPVQGRIAVVIYVAVGDARPELLLKELRLEEVNGQLLPVAVIHNQGNAHARTAGFVDVTDAGGKRLEFAVASLPILPGQTRQVPLHRTLQDEAEPEALLAPLDIRGAIEWQTGKVPVDTRIEQLPVTD